MVWVQDKWFGCRTSGLDEGQVVWMQDKWFRCRTSGLGAVYDFKHYVMSRTSREFEKCLCPGNVQLEECYNANIPSSKR